LIATGGQPLRPPIDGIDAANVHLLRSQSDATQIIDDIEDAESAVVVGSSFIGMEVAASLRHRDLDVTVASLESVPFENILGAEVGQYFKSMHADNGVDFELGRGVSDFNTSNHRADSVTLEDDTTLEADVFIVGVGVRPATAFLADSDLELDSQGAIIVDETLQAAEDVYAAGDVAAYPDPDTGDLTRIEHWRLAEQQGRRAADAMAGDETVTFDALPFFWTRQFGVSIKYVGHADDWDDLQIDGDISEGDFLATYRNANDQPIAWAGTRGAELCAIQAAHRR
jgi:NADPH-dependent 2,4-dienoyl-CoA reductase/sulfur reductase-like enzyme